MPTTRKTTPTLYEDAETDMPLIPQEPETLFGALIKAQLAFSPISKDKLNPHFKSRYADLDSIMKSIREPLLKNNLLLTSYFEMVGESLCLITKIVHSLTGSDIKIEYPISLSANEQQNGSKITYARRYSICALLNLVADDDDDGNAAVSKWAELQPLTYSKPKLLEWAAIHTPHTHASEDERRMSLEKLVAKNLYDTDSKWKILCWENRDRYNPEKQNTAETETIS